MNFKIDENLPVEVADLLKERGHDAVTVIDESLGGAPDPRVSEACAGELRVLITLDTDFGDIGAYPPGDHPGIIVLRLKRQDRAHVLAVVARLRGILEFEDPRGRLWIVGETRIRMRPLRCGLRPSTGSTRFASLPRACRRAQGCAFDFGPSTVFRLSTRNFQLDRQSQK